MAEARPSAACDTDGHDLGGTRVTRSHAPYRHRLELLAQGGLQPYLDAWASQRPLQRAGPWRRVYGKLRPGRSPWAVLVYDAPGMPTLGVSLHETVEDRKVEPTADGDLGRVEIGAAGDDPALPGLAAVLASLDRARVVRYHPGNRCAVLGGTGVAARFVKVFSNEDVDDQHEAEARWTASRQRVLSFAVARPFGWDEATRSSWYGVVAGEPLKGHLAQPGIAELVHRVGASVGELAVAPLRPGRSDDDESQLSRTRRTLLRAATAAPALAGDLERAFDIVEHAHAGLRGRSLVPIHGAAHLGQWLVDDRARLGLVDFDRFALGEPEFDLATFVVELRAELGPDDAASLEGALVTVFHVVAGPFDSQRFAVYLVEKQLSRVARSAAGLAVDGEDRARHLLAALEAPLRELASG